MDQIVVFSDWEFFQCLHHLGKLQIVEELPYRCVLLKDMFLEDTPYSKQSQLEEEITALSKVSIDIPKNRYSNDIYDPDCEIKLIDQYALILGLEYKNDNPSNDIIICSSYDALSNEYIELHDLKGVFSQTLIFMLKKKSFLSYRDILDLIDFIKKEHLRSKDQEKFLNLLRIE